MFINFIKKLHFEPFLLAVLTLACHTSVLQYNYVEVVTLNWAVFVSLFLAHSSRKSLMFSGWITLVLMFIFAMFMFAGYYGKDLSGDDGLIYLIPFVAPITIIPACALLHIYIRKFIKYTKEKQNPSK